MRIAPLGKFWWIVQKDLVCEFRSWRVWPRMMALGLTVSFLLSYQLSGPGVPAGSIAGSLCWITICIAALLTLGEGVAVEREHGCWEGLKHYPVGASSVFLAKLLVNVTGLAILQGVVVPFLLYTLRVSVSSPWELALVMLLGNVGISAVGTVVGALGVGSRDGHGLLALLLLPLWVPVLLAASKATTLVLLGQDGPELARWLQLLSACAVIYVAAGLMLFEFAIED